MNAGAQETKQCCARLYESEFVTQLLGDSFHPGGARLTERLGRMLDLSPDSHVVDAAAGKGTSAMLLARQFGCRVTGVDLSRQNLERAAVEAARQGLSDRVRFVCGDAEHLPLAGGVADAVICECAFCTFPDKTAAAGQFVRVLTPGGRVGLSDVTRAPGGAGELDDLMSWIACLGDARTSDEYAAWLAAEGMTVNAVERHDDVLRDLVGAVRTRLFAAEVLAGLNKAAIPSLDLEAAKRMARQALTAIDEGRLGYAIVIASLP